MSSLREALEAALVENPDDLAAHMAYADHLHELGDPRGELIQTQLALENDQVTGPERTRLAAREQELLAATRAAYLGKKLAKVLGPQSYEPVDLTVERGWLTGFQLEGPARAALTTALATAPEARLLRTLGYDYLEWPWNGDADKAGVPALYKAKFPNLRRLALGCTAEFHPELHGPLGYNSFADLPEVGEDLWGWIATLPRLEELYLECGTRLLKDLFALPSLGNLRVLVLHLSAGYPLDVLAENPAAHGITHLALHPQASEDEAYLHDSDLEAIAKLPALTHLRFHKSDAGDGGVQVLLDSGLLGRLRFLDLAMGTVTNAGAARLAAANLSKLEVLDLSANALTDTGVSRLTRKKHPGLMLRLGDQEPGGQRTWLSEGEME